MVDDDHGTRRIPPLEEQLCFALYAATNAITRSYRPLLAELGLTYPQYLVLLALWHDGPAPVGHLAARLELDAHALSPLVRRLDDAGLVRRVRAADRRVVVVELTEAGRDLEAGAAAAQERVACASGLSPLELAALRRELRGLSGRLDPRSRTAPQQAERPRPLEGDAS